ncbi:MAG: hypothetical protein ACXW6K_24125, partial [Candidatus Binatia bacterium]
MEKKSPLAPLFQRGVTEYSPRPEWLTRIYCLAEYRQAPRRHDIAQQQQRKITPFGFVEHKS